MYVYVYAHNRYVYLFKLLNLRCAACYNNTTHKMLVLKKHATKIKQSKNIFFSYTRVKQFSSLNFVNE